MGVGFKFSVMGGLPRQIEIKSLSAFNLKTDVDSQLKKIIRQVQDITFKIDCYLNDLDEDWHRKRQWTEQPVQKHLLTKGSQKKWVASPWQCSYSPEPSNLLRPDFSRNPFMLSR